MIFTNIDGKWHKEVQLVDGPIVTECGLDVPHGSEWSHEEPTEKLCKDCFPKKKAA